MYDLDKHREIEWLAVRYLPHGPFVATSSPDARRTWFGGIARVSRIFAAGGLSSRVGSYLAVAVRQHDVRARI
jgi:hypothetical protein